MTHQYASSANRRSFIPYLKLNQLVECRGSIWRYLGEKNNFWQLQLVRRGAHFSEQPVNVWALPQLEAGVRNSWQVVENVIVSRNFIKRWENLKPIRNVSWDMVVIDECHHFVKDKNAASI